MYWDEECDFSCICGCSRGMVKQGEVFLLRAEMLLFFVGENPESTQ